MARQSSRTAAADDDADTRQHSLSDHTAADNGALAAEASHEQKNYEQTIDAAVVVDQNDSDVAMEENNSADDNMSGSASDGSSGSDGSSSDGAKSEGDHGSDDEFAGHAAAQAAGDGDRAARAGRALRANVRKPQEFQKFTKPPHRQPQVSRMERRRQQRELEQQRKRQQQHLQEQQQQRQRQQQELAAAHRAAAAGRLTRHTRKLIAITDDSPSAAAAALGGNTAINSPATAQAADAVVVKQDVGVTAKPAAAVRGLKGEALLLQQQLEQLLKRSQEAAEEAERAGGSKRQLLRHSRGNAAAGDMSQEDASEDHSVENGECADRVTDRRMEARGGDHRSGRFARVGSEQEEEDEDDDRHEEEDDDSDDDKEEEEQEQPLTARKRYPLRDRGKLAVKRYSPRHGKMTNGRSSHAGRGSGEKRQDRHSCGRGSRRYHSSSSRRHRRGSFGPGSSSSDGDDDHLVNKLRSDARWSSFMAACGAPGPYHTAAVPHSTPAAAAAAAAATAAAATGVLSPGRAALDRRGSGFFGPSAAAAATAAAEGLAAGSGTGLSHWGIGTAAEARAGLSGRDAAAAAAGKEGRGGLGAELITPLQVDPSIEFDQVGGLDHYLAALKEMIFLPLLYPEIFDRFGVTPPRGVLFHGPPGTGKTLVARALAAQASKAAGQKVTFYMRKGADLLSKWVGEAEKQLRLLFEEANRNQPAIIFFDEIDGLAPVRSSKQDQVHNSIVSTLLALMDGLDNRGRIVLIGATNRPDALDPALRRPGRFDRELLFPLPDLAARRSILCIHTRSWQPAPADSLVNELAVMTGGYCGADIKALCAEASLAALRRVYPQIYDSNVKLLINPAAVVVTRQDFLAAMQGLTPAAHRAMVSHARALNPVVKPCLAKPLGAALLQLQYLFPPAAACLANTAAAVAAVAGAGADGSSTSSSAHNGNYRRLQQQQRLSSALSSKQGSWKSALNKIGSSNGSRLFGMVRPRLLLAGPPGSGQQQLGAAVLAALEGLPVRSIGLPSLLANTGCRCVEEALVSAFAEARRAAPAIVYWPQAHLWWAAAGSGLRCALIALLDDLPADLPVLLLATAELARAPAALRTEDSAAAAELAAAASAKRLILHSPSSQKAQQEQQQRQQLLQSSLSRHRLSMGNGSLVHQAAAAESLEQLGLEPSLAALFPELGGIEESYGGLQPQGLECQEAQQQQQQQQAAHQQQGQHGLQLPPSRMSDPTSQTEAAAAAACDSVLGHVLLGPVGAGERRQMFKDILAAAAAPAAPSPGSQQQQPPPPPLPLAPDAAADQAVKAAAAAAARAAYEDDQAALRSLRIVLRSIVTRALSQKRYRLFAEPSLLDDEGGYEALQAMSCPMDLLTMLYKVDHQQYPTVAAFLADAHLIVRCAEELYGEPEVAAATLPAAAGPPSSAVAQPAATAPSSAAAAMAFGSIAVNGTTGDPGLGGANNQLPMLARSLPAVRVAVCKEISRAMELRDALETQVYQLIAPGLVQACEAITAKGGPAPPPPGMQLPQQLMPPPPPPAARGQGGMLAAAGRESSSGRGAADTAAAGSKATRSMSRLSGKHVDTRLMHADPEALMRALKPKHSCKPAAAAAAGGLPSQQQGQLSSHATEGAGVDVAQKQEQQKWQQQVHIIKHQQEQHEQQGTDQQLQQQGDQQQEQQLQGQGLQHQQSPSILQAGQWYQPGHINQPRTDADMTDVPSLLQHEGLVCQQQQPANGPSAAAVAGVGAGTQAFAKAADGAAQTNMPADAHTALQQDGSASALKPVTNGQSRKRLAPGALEGQPPCKHPAAAARKAAAGNGEGATGDLVKSAAGFLFGGLQGTAQVTDQPSKGNVRNPAAAAATAEQIKLPEHHPQPQLEQQNGNSVQQNRLAAAYAEANAGLMAAKQAADNAADLQHEKCAVGAAAAQEPYASDVAAAEALLQRLVLVTAGMQLSALEMVHARLSRVIAAAQTEQDRTAVLQRMEYVTSAVARERQLG